ncbi:MAG: hypothetical protein DMG17_30985 [Acidobacteria bacterium]|nr:MAG: hypothetical protein DMG17_30985 [Acidobacteriota bacterium]
MKARAWRWFSRARYFLQGKTKAKTMAVHNCALLRSWKIKVPKLWRMNRPAISSMIGRNCAIGYGGGTSRDVVYGGAHRHLPSSAFPRMGSFVQSRRFRFFNIDENA